MKKIYTLITIFCISLGVNAQNDLAISFENINEGSSQKGTADAEIRIKNNGTSTIKDGEPLFFTWSIGNAIFHSLSGTRGVFSAVPLNRDLTPGGELTLPIEITFTGSNTNPVQVCVICLGADETKIDQSSNPWTNTWDDNLSDNSICFVYTPSLTTSIEALNKMTDKLFFANGQLVYDWTNVNEANETIVKMTNISGQTVMSQTVELNEGRNSLNVNNLSTGLYLVTFQVNGEFSSKKVYVK